MKDLQRSDGKEGVCARARESARASAGGLTLKAIYRIEWPFNFSACCRISTYIIATYMQKIS